MERALVVACVALLFGCRREEPAPVSKTAPIVDVGAAPSPIDSAAQIPAFSGKYDSTEGPATITQKGFDVKIDYQGGHADCTAEETSLVCEWREGQDYGLARLRRVGGGKLVGTWGVGKSETSGGEWTFVPIAQ